MRYGELVTHFTMHISLILLGIYLLLDVKTLVSARPDMIIAESITDDEELVFVENEEERPGL